MPTIKNKIISVIIPVYNVERYVAQCLESILNQTYKFLEIIIVNDGSTDDSYNICKKYADTDKRIKLFSKKNGGVSSARNYGLSYVTGDYVYFMDSDDYLELNACEIMIKNIKNFDLLCFNWSCTYKNNKIRNGVQTDKILSRNETLDLCVQNENSFSGYLWNKLFKADIIKDNHIKFNKNISICEDLLFVVEYIQYCDKVNSISNVLYNYRMRISAASKRFNLNKFSTIFASYQSLINIYKKENLEAKIFLEYEYLYNYYLYKRIFDKNNVSIDRKILNEYKNIKKSKKVSRKKIKELFIIKNFNLLFRIKNRLFNRQNNNFVMYE